MAPHLAPQGDESKRPLFLTYVYGDVSYADWLKHHCNEECVIHTYKPLLPIFSCKNSLDRNRRWRQIRAECQQTGLYFTHACISGLQYHNNGILSAKRTAAAVLAASLEGKGRLGGKIAQAELL